MLEVKLTKRQVKLLADLRAILKDGPRNTHQLAVDLGHHQSYESVLRDRLFRLEALGLVRSESRQNGRWVVERKWFLVPSQETAAP